MTSSLDMIRGRSNVVTLTNKSGGALVAGDVCVIDTANDEAATTTTSAASVLKVYIAAESIANDATGKFYSAGFCPLVTPSASVTRGRYLFTHTVAKQAAESATYGAGAFGVILKSGTTPSVWLFGTTAQGSGGGVARSGSTTDEHLAVWNGSDVDSLKDGGVPASGGAPTTSKYVTTAADGGLSAEVVIPGLAGSADIAGAGGAGTAHEFESGDTAPTWSSAPAVTDVGTTVLSHLYAKATDATERFAYYDWSPAGDFDARCSLQIGFFAISSTPDGDFGLCIGNSDNSVRLVITRRIHNFGGTIHGIHTLSYASSTYTDRGFLASAFNGLNPAYLRIKRVSTTSSFYWSAGGILWNFIGSTTQAITVAKIGFRFAGGASSEFYGICDWLRTDV